MVHPRVSCAGGGGGGDGRGDVMACTVTCVTCVHFDTYQLCGDGCIGGNSPREGEEVGGGGGGDISRAVSS